MPRAKACSAGAVKRQKDPDGPDPNLFEVANVVAGSSLSYPRIYSGNQKMQLSLLYSNGGGVTGDVTVVVGGRAAGNCKLPPTGGWETYKNATCLGAVVPLFLERRVPSSEKQSISQDRLGTSIRKDEKARVSSRSVAMASRRQNWDDAGHCFQLQR
jgi:hypothetical protein